MSCSLEALQVLYYIAAARRVASKNMEIDRID